MQQTRAVDSRFANLSKRDQNSMDFIRWLVAAMVIFSHAFPLGMGEAIRRYDPIVILTNNQSATGGVGLAMIFVISGFYITLSMLRSKDWWKFLKARILRIYPPLIAVVLVAMFIIGPLVTTLSLGDYFTNVQTYQYGSVLLLFKTSYFLPGVFESNVYPDAVNGSLWTLFFSFAFYFMTMFLFLLGMLRRKPVLALFLAVWAFRGFMIEIYPALGITLPGVDPISDLMRTPNFYYGTQLLMYFLSGMVFYLYQDRIPLRRSFFLFGLVLMLLAIQLNVWNMWMATSGAYSMFYIATSPRMPMKFWAKYGDYSLGLYLYGFPVQQFVTYLFDGSMEPMLNFAISLPVAAFLSVLSWRFIEQPAMRLRKVSLRTTLGLRRTTAPMGD
ncbi:MAG: acyltransferase family protein [Chloroflexota bacterium]